MDTPQKPLQTANCALLTFDVLLDVANLFTPSGNATPTEFHALSSLIEAAVLHEKLYVYEVPRDGLGSALDDLFKWGLIEHGEAADACDALLRERGLEVIAERVFDDRYRYPKVTRYLPSKAEELLANIVEYEKKLGFSRMSEILDGDDDELQEQVISEALTHRFSEEDIDIFDGSFRRARAFATCGIELDLHLCTGLAPRPFLIGDLGDRRRNALKLFDLVKAELDDVNDSDIPKWRRISIPPLTRIVLTNCRDSSAALPNEIMRVRHELRRFRETLTNEAAEFKATNTLAEKRRQRREAEEAWAALLEKTDTHTRVTHLLYDVVANKGKAFVERDKLDQIILKVPGLTDLWRVVSDAPTIERNAKLLSRVFKTDVDLGQWSRIQTLASELEDLMKKNRPSG